MNTKAIHMSSEPNEKLYAKFEAEMEEYKAELLAMPHDEILENAYEYATRQDILLVLQTHDLTDKQCVALLKSEHPMRDILVKWERCEYPYTRSLRDTIESTANDVLRSEFKEKWHKEHGER